MKKIIGGLIFAGAILSNAAFAVPLPSGWACTGNCGSLGADGVVTLPSGASSYNYVSTNGSTNNTGNLGLGSETNSSIAKSPLFAATAGDLLEFDFNYVTSDGSGFADYGWARLLDSSMTQVALLFTARTTTGGNTVPGFGMPAIDATIVPSTVPIIGGGPTWSPLGSSSGGCFSTGCGYTDWVHATYNILADGNYYLEFGAVNWTDTGYDSGLAFAGTKIEGVDIGGGQIPEPGSLALIGLGLAGVGMARRRKKSD